MTVLTSYDDADLKEAGYALSVADLVAKRAAQARDFGCGIVCSAEEAARLRGIVGQDVLLVTPGIRPAGSEAGDQKRIMTPAAAIKAGADYLVVARPVVAAADQGFRRRPSSPKSPRRRAKSPASADRRLQAAISGPVPRGGEPMSDMRLIVAGAGGRMGRALVQAIARDRRSGAGGRAGGAWLGLLLGRSSGVLAGLGANGIPLVMDLAQIAPKADGLIDFTIPEASVSNAAASQHGSVHVIGTTGMSADDDAAVKKAASRTAIVKSGNMSLGVNLLAALVRRRRGLARR